MDAIKAYKAGALRTAVTSVWVAVVYDLIAKYRELSASGDSAAAAFIRKWDDATTQQNIKSLLELELRIVDYATSNVQLLNPIAKIHLERLREDRNVCAHPTFYSEENLFEPSVEMVRLHLVNAIDLVLSQAPLQGKAIFDQFDVDVRSIGFPSDRAGVHDYVERRYLSQTRQQKITNFGIVLAKSLLKGVPTEWEKERSKIVDALTAIRDRASSVWPLVEAEVVKMIERIEPSGRSRAISVIAVCPELWSRLDGSCQQALEATVENMDAEKLVDYHVLAGVRVPRFRQKLERVIRRLSMDQLRDALELEVLIEYWEKACEIYGESGSFRGSEANFRDFVRPFGGRLEAEQLDRLLVAVSENGQNWDAEQTPWLLADVVHRNRRRSLPTGASRERFARFVEDRRLERRYEEVMVLFELDGWKGELVPVRESPIASNGAAEGLVGHLQRR